MNDVEKYLRQVIADAEMELVRLGRYPQAWREVRAHLSGPMPAFGHGTIADVLLGPREPKRDAGVVPSRRLRTFKAIRRAVLRCPRCRASVSDVSAGLLGHHMIAAVKDHHPKVYRRYEAEVDSPVPSAIQETPAWAAAFRAATAHAALRKLDSPAAVATARAYIEQQRILAWTVSTLVPQSVARARERLERQITDGRRPGLESKMTRRAFAKMAESNQAQVKELRLPVWEAVRNEHQRLCSQGLSRTRAAQLIASDARIQARIKEVAAATSSRMPWIGSFYSFAAIRKIIGL